MAERRILLSTHVVFQGETNVKPNVPSFRGSSLLVATTGYTQSDALTALSGTSATSRCFTLPISNYDEVVLTAYTAPLYVACAAVRPGSQLYFSTNQCKYVYENDSQTFELTCPITWNRAFMTGLYATGISMNSPYTVKGIQNLSATTYQDQKLAMMTDINYYYNFCNPVGDGLTFITQSEMGKMYSPIQSAYYRDDNYSWKNGEIDYWYGYQGFSITFPYEGVYTYVDNNSPYSISCTVTIVAFEPDSPDYNYEIFSTYRSPNPWSMQGGYDGNATEPPSGEIGAIGIMIDSGGYGLNYTAHIVTSGMGTLYDSGATDAMTPTDRIELSNDIEIQRIEIEVST